MSDLRFLPSVDSLLNLEKTRQLIDKYSRPLTLEAVRDVLDNLRQEFLRDSQFANEGRLSVNEILSRVEGMLAQQLRPTLGVVLNATGVILHTNLGRAPLSEEAVRAMAEIAPGYSTLEFNLQTGKRGSRSIHAENLLVKLTNAEAALVVNNNAAAVLLALTALAKRRKVIISRTQLIEIGGGFRIPDVMKQSGARLIEVGTTNRVHLSDYEAELVNGPALLMRAHHSNFRLIGFTSEPSLAEMVEIARKYRIPLLEDLGSGAFLDTSQFGLAKEPMVQESIRSGVDLVCFSGDKLVGGPQAGIIVGKADLINRLKKHPLARAIRADKLCLSALSATLLHYLKGEALQKIPVWRMIAASYTETEGRANAWRDRLGMGTVLVSHSTIGGGSMPGEVLPTCVLALSPRKVNEFLTKLRRMNPPIIARVENDRVVFDPRTILTEQEDIFLQTLKLAWTGEE